MKIYSGKYGKDTQRSNALVTNLLKYPEISRTMVQMYPQFSLTYFTEGFGRYAHDIVIGNNKYEWFVNGRTSLPSTCTGTYSGDGSGNSLFSVEFEENYINPNDVVRFYDKTQAIAIGEMTPSAGGFTQNFKLDTNDSSATFASSNATVGYTVGKLGSKFGEKSARGYGNTKYPDKYHNFVSIARKSREITGDYLTDITWIENGGNKVWFFQDEKQSRDEFAWELEMNRWYGRSTMDADGNPLVFDADGTPIISGDGFFAQIDSSNIDTYSGQLTEKRITDFIAQLKYESGMVNGGSWTVHTGSGGFKQFDRAMKQYYVENGNVIYDATAGREVALGSDFSTYHALGHKITLAYNPIFDDKNLHSNLASDGFTKEGYNLVFCQNGMQDGVSNIEIITKGAGGTNRGLTIKYVPGMINPFDPKSMLASTSEDSFRVEYLSQGGLVVRNPKSCGVLNYV